jgi:hypothetical protein
MSRAFGGSCGRWRRLPSPEASPARERGRPGRCSGGGCAGRAGEMPAPPGGGAGRASGGVP